MKLFKHVLYWILPALVINLIELFYYEFDDYLVKNLVQNLSIGLVLCLGVEVFITKLKPLLVSFILAIHLLFIAFESLFYAGFHTFFSASAIYIFLETNQAEASEFISTYLDYTSLLVFFGIILITSTYYKWIRSRTASALAVYKWWVLGFILLIMLALKFSAYIIPNFSYITTRSVYKYYQESQKYQDLQISEPESSHFKVSSLDPEQAQTFVLVIGESTTRRALGIYGCYRNTTPLLSKRKNELEVFTDVISSQTHTIEALKESLTLNHLKTDKDVSIIQLMNQAGFKTYWLSNQRPVGLHETLLTKLSLAADHVVYTNTAKWGSKTPLDEVLLPYIDQALLDQAPKKFIVVNLLATHNDYEKRYPPAFDNFTNQPKTNFTSPEATQKINTYHNSITYVDYLLDTIINRVKQQSTSSYVLYVSDHGDEVYEDEDFIGHNDGYKATASMFEIPFILWQSSKYKSSNPIRFEVSRPYVMRDFIHSFSDLSRLDFKVYDSTKSIFSKHYQAEIERLVGKSVNYDQDFKE